MPFFKGGIITNFSEANRATKVKKGKEIPEFSK